MIGFAVAKPDYAGKWADTPPKQSEDPKKAKTPNLQTELPVHAEVIAEMIDQSAKKPLDPGRQEVNFTGTKPKWGPAEQKRKGISLDQIQRKPALEIYQDPPNSTYQKPLSQRI